MEGHPAQRKGGGGARQDGEAGGERIAKVLARAGVASRREAERLIAAGRIALNGAPLTSPAVKVGAGDVVTLDGQPVAAAEPTRLFLYHKPPGLVTTHRDPQGRTTVFAALPAGLPRLISVGRLDLNSEGLLLLTNDGGLARTLELPASGLVRRYRARARGRIDAAALERLKEGVTVEGVRYGPIEAKLEPGRPGAANVWISLALAEGKNREVRKVLQAQGLVVNRLIRIAYGPFELGLLRPGRLEEVAPAALRKRLGALAGPAIGPRYKPGWARPKPRRRGGARPGKQA
ncbi:MAG: rRNA pseudouridine synthase [Caulobacteraceae bacterium]|nr:rRNA pseudouridine synthase [Caulobacteraceae bacterium]